MSRLVTAQTTPQLVLGVLIILVGLMFTLDRLDIMDAGEVLRFWPLLLVVYGATRFFQPPGTKGRLWGGILILAGTALFIDRLWLFDFRLTSLWPLLLVIGGAAIVLRTTRRRMPDGQSGPEAAPTSTEQMVNGMVVFGGIERTVSSSDFRGGELTAILGGCDVDLRQATIRSSPAVIDVFTMMGGLEIKVPATWNVEVNGFPFLGGFEDGTSHPADPQAPRLIIRGTAIMGGVEISN